MSNNPNEMLKINQEPDEMSLKDFIYVTQLWGNYLLSKKWIILFVATIGGLCGLGYASLQKAVYTATTTFVLEEGERSGLSQYAGMAAMVGIDISGGGGGLFQGENIIELYKSRNMLQRALLSTAKFSSKKQLLIDRYLEFNKWRDRWEKSELKNISFADTGKFTVVQDSIIKVVISDIRKNNLTISKPDKKSSIFKVEVRSTNEEFSKNFNDQIVSTVNRFYVDTKTKKSLQNVSILQNQVDSVRAIMNGAIYSAASTVDATPNLNPARQILRAPVQRSQINAETNKVMLAELVKQLELSKIMVRKDMPLIQIVDQPIFPLEKAKAGKVKSTILGGILAGFIAILILIIMRIYKKLINE